MKTNSTFFIVPGFKQKATDKSYSWLREYLEKKRFKVIPVPIKWDYRVMSDYINDFKDCYLNNKSEINYVLGFSYGSVITISTASELKPNKIFLCSLSPDFKEDQHVIKPWIRKLVGKNRLTDAMSRSAIEIAKKLQTPAVIFYGEEEGKKYPQLKLRSEETAKLTHAKLVVIPISPHQIDYPEYQKVIIKELEAL